MKKKKSKKIETVQDNKSKYHYEKNQCVEMEWKRFSNRQYVVFNFRNKYHTFCSISNLAYFSLSHLFSSFSLVWFGLVLFHFNQRFTLNIVHEPFVGTMYQSYKAWLKRVNQISVK